MKKRSLFQRILSLTLAILLAVPSSLGNIVSAAGFDENEKTPAQPVAQSDAPISISAQWQDSEFTNGTAFNLVEYDNSTNAVKLKVSYASSKIREEGYKAGELIISVKGIGKVNRAKVVEALVGADKDGAAAKTRDWSYTWNKTTDTYTLTNNNPIQGNSVFSGYFELVWNLKARDTIHHYSQDDIKANLYIPDEDAISSEVLSFSNETKCDDFSIDVDRGTLYSANGINGGQSVSDNVFIKYTLTSHVDMNSRGLKDGEEEFLFSTDNAGIGSGGIITYATVPYEKISNGNYRVTLKSNVAAGEQYAIVAYNKETYVGKTIRAYINHYGAFNEGDVNGNMNYVFLAEDAIEFVMPPDFDFNDQGGLFHESKASAYENKAYEDKKFAEQVADRGGHIPGQRMVNGTVETFYLGFSVQFPVKPGNSVTTELVDDFLYIAQNNGDYRQLKPGDYEYESVVITSTDTVTNENEVPIKSGKYPVKIFAAQDGKVLDMSKYPVRPEESFVDLEVERTVTETNDTVYANAYAPIRVEPGAEAKQIGSLKTGDSITRIETIDNYGWSKVVTKDGQEGYIYSKYLQSEEPSSPAELVWEGLWMDYEQEIDMPAGTTTIAVRYENLEETIWYDWHPDYVDQPACAINIRFHLDEDGWEHDKQSNLIDGQVVNTMFINLYNSEGELDNTNNYEDDYDDDAINIDLAQKDIDTYGRYLDRDKGTISFYGGEKSDYTSYTDIAAIEGSGSKFSTSLTIGANFEFAETEEPNKFSLYTILADGLSLNGYKTLEDIWSVMTLSGFDMSETKLANACTPEVIKNYNGSGRTYIALHFDFGDTSVPQNGKIRATFNLKVTEKVAKTSGTLPARSAVIIDRKVDTYTIGKVADNGQWADKTGFWSDIDRDGNTEETLARSYDHTSFTYADSSHFEITKYVETSYTDDWVQLPDVPAEEFGGTYKYKVTIRNGNSIASNIVVKDILETGANMQWQGTLQSVDLSACETLGMTGTVYYSTSDKPSEALNTGDWSTELKDGTKAVAVDFGDSVLEAGKELSVIFVMKAPEDTSLKDKITENGAVVSLAMSDSATGNETKEDVLATNFVQVKLTPPLRSIVAKKTDAVDGTALKGATLELYDKESGEKVGEAVTNTKGYATFHNLPADNRTYVLKETQAPYGYELMEDAEVVLNGEDKRVTVGDPRKGGIIEVYKVNNLDTEMPVEGATYAIFDVTDQELFDKFAHGEQSEDFLTEEQRTKLIEKQVGTAVTDENGSAIFEKLPWGKYLITEWETPDGYDLNTTLYFMVVDRENVETPLFLSTENVQKDISIELNKYVSTVDGEETEIALPGATFELLRVLKSGEKRVGLYVTDENGQILLTELPYGSYFFREYRAPVGYSQAKNVEFELAPENADISLNIYDQRKPGNLIINKKDDLGNMVQDIEFTLYAEDKTEVISKVKTDEYGVAEINGLEWGTYYLKETAAPDYYVENEELKQIEINKDSLKWVIEWINETVKGAVTLTKTNEDGDVKLPGAVYTLYQDDGAVIGNYVTDENGQLTVENLPWGGYYFLETVAPVGYSLSDETIRFAVNATNAGAAQEMEVTDPLDARAITLTKKIKAADINFANGMPTFIFKVEGTDFYGVKHEYYKSLVFNEAYVNANTDDEGYVSQDLTFSELIAGEYLATEQDSSRYLLTQITDIVNGYTGSGDQDGAIFDLVNNNNGSAVYVNEKYENQDYSDTQTLTNIVKSYKKLTGLKATYGSDVVEAQSAVDPDLLTVTAVYDDGSTKVLTAEEYTLSLDSYLTQDGSYEQRFPNKNGSYTVTVTHTDPETNITKSGRFAVTVAGQVPVVVSMSATQGFATLGSKILPEIFTVTATYNDGTTGVLSPDQYTVSPDVAPNYEGDMEVTIALDLDAVLNEGRPVSTTATVTVQTMPILMAGPSFNSRISSAATSVVFTDDVAPNGVSTIDVSEAQDKSIVAWTVGRTFYVSTQKVGIEIAANADSSKMFYNKNMLTSIDLSMLNTSEVTNMRNMFFYCSKLTELDVSGFDTAKVTDMINMFGDCLNLTKLDLSSFNTSKVTNMNGMFSGCRNLSELDVSGFDTTNVINMGGMFSSCNVTELDVSSFDTTNVINMGSMFAGCKKLNTIYASDAWSTGNVSYSQDMFNNCTKLVGGAGTKFSTSYVTADLAKIDGGTADPGYFTDPLNLHYPVVPLGETKMPDLSTINDRITYTVTGYEVVSGEEFISLDAATGAVTGVAEGKATIKVSAQGEKGGAYAALAEVYIGPIVQVVYSADDGSLTFYKTDDGITEGESYKGKTVTNLYRFTETETNAFTSMANIPWYSQRASVKSVVFADEIKPLSTASWFEDMTYCTSMDLAKLNTSAVTNMSNMFSDCYRLTKLDLSSFNTAAVTNMSGMFMACSSLTTIYASDAWSTGKVTSSNTMFYGCQKLVGGAGTKYSSSYSGYLTADRAKIDGGAPNPGYFTSPLNLHYSDVPLGLGEVRMPELSWAFDNITYTVTGYEVVSGEEFVSLDKTTGAVTGIADGKAVVKVSAEDMNGCTYTVLADVYIGTIVQVIYSADDDSLTFYKTDDGITEGESYKGKTVTNLYQLTEAETSGFTTDYIPWFGVEASVKSVVVADEIKPLSTAYWFGGMYNCTSMDLAKLNTSAVTDMSEMFNGCSGLTELDVSEFDTSAVTDMNQMFSACESLEELDLSSFDTSAVTDMSGMFGGCFGLTELDVSSFNTSKVTNMSSMFSSCNVTELDLSNFDTANVTNMSGMFSSCNVTELDVSSFDTSAVTDMRYMFYDCTNLATIYASGDWSTGNVSSSSRMFYGCQKLVGGAGTKYSYDNVAASYAKIDGGAEDPGYFTSPIALAYEGLDLGSTVMPTVKLSVEGYTVTGYDIVSGDEYITLDTKTGAVTSIDAGVATVRVYAENEAGNVCSAEATFHTVRIAQAVYSADDGSLTFYKTNKDIVEGETYNGKAVTAVYTGIEDTNFTFDIDSWSGNVPWLNDGNFEYITSVVVADAISPISTAGWFAGLPNCTSMDLTKLNTSKVTDMTAMFAGCENLEELDVSGFNTSKVTNMSGMFGGCYGLTELDLSSFDTANVTNMSGMFSECNVTELDLSNFDTANVTNMSYMFESCMNLTSLDLSNFNTSKVTNMSFMFCACESLEELDLSGFNTSNVAYMDFMFAGNSSLTTIYVSDGWSAESVESSEGMFVVCFALVGGAGTVYTDEHMDAAYAKIDGGTADPGYLTGVSLSYGLVGIDETVTPQVTVPYGFTVTGYEVVSGDEYITLNATTGAATGIKEGFTVIQVTAKNNAGKTITAKAYVDVGSTAYAVFSGDDGSLTFYKTGDEIIEGESYNGKEASIVYTDIETTVYTVNLENGSNNVPWVNDGIAQFVTKVVFADEIKPVSTAGWFMYMENCTSMNLSKLNTSNVTNMTAMFMGCTGLTELDVSHFDTSKVTNMFGMFMACAGLTELDVSHFDTSNVTIMFGMFMECRQLTTIYASDSWSTENVTDGDLMFAACENLVGGAGTVYNDALIYADYAKIDGGTADPGYFTAAADAE